MPSNKDHHFITAKYLNLWIYSPRKVVQYNLEKKNVYSPDPFKVCKKPYLYLIGQAPEGQKLLLESYFQEIESNGMAAIHNFIENGLITKEEREDIAWFIAIHRTRTIRSLEDHEKITIQLAKKDSQKLLNNPARLKELVDDLEAKGVSDIELIKQDPKKYFEDIWNDIENGKYTLKIKNNREIWLPLMFGSIEPLVRKYLFCRWYFLKSPANASFITSDNPVVHLPYFPPNVSPVKENVDLLEITFPISPNNLLLMRDNREPGIFYKKRCENVGSIKELNIRTLTHANRYFFSNNGNLATSLVNRFHKNWQTLKNQDGVAAYVRGEINVVDTSTGFPKPIYRDLP